MAEVIVFVALRIELLFLLHCFEQVSLVWCEEFVVVMEFSEI